VISFFEYWHIQGSVIGTLLLLGLCLVLVPLFAGRRLGPLDIPAADVRFRWLFALCGVGLLAAVLAGSQPWVEPVSLSDCGFFSDEYAGVDDPEGRIWKLYDAATEHGRIWVSCVVTTPKAVQLDDVITAAGRSGTFFVGYKQQRSTTTENLAAGFSDRVAAVVEPMADQGHLHMFDQPTLFTLVLEAETRRVTASLPRLDLRRLD